MKYGMRLRFEILREGVELALIAIYENQNEETPPIIHIAYKGVSRNGRRNFYLFSSSRKSDAVDAYNVARGSFILSRPPKFSATDDRFDSFLKPEGPTGDRQFSSIPSNFLEPAGLKVTA